MALVKLTFKMQFCRFLNFKNRTKTGKVYQLNPRLEYSQGQHQALIIQARKFGRFIFDINIERACAS